MEGLTMVILTFFSNRCSQWLYCCTPPVREIAPPSIHHGAAVALPNTAHGHHFAGRRPNTRCRFVYILAPLLLLCSATSGLSPLAPDQWQFFLVSYAALFAINNVLRWVASDTGSSDNTMPL